VDDAQTPNRGVREGPGYVHIPVRRVVCRPIFLCRGVVFVVLMGLDEVVLGANKYAFIFSEHL